MNIKGSILVFVVLIILAIGAFGSWYFMNQSYRTLVSRKDEEISGLEKQLADLVDELNELKNQDSSGGSLDTSNWLTYKNLELGFSFRYPAEFALIQDDLVSGVGKTTTGSKVLVLKNSSSQQEPILKLWVNYTGEEQAVDYYYELTPTSGAGGVSVSKIKEHPKSSESDPDLTEYLAYTQDKISDLDFRFIFFHKAGAKSFQESFEAVLASFTLT